MKKTVNSARDLEQGVTQGIEQARDWAAPRVEAAVNWAVPRIQQGLESASPKIQEGLKSAAHNLADGVATVTPRLQEGLAHLGPKIHDAVEDASPRIQEALDKTTPALATARDKVVGEYLPLLSEQLGKASEAVHHGLEQAPEQIDAVARRFADSPVVNQLQEQASELGQQGRQIASAAADAATKELGKPQKSKKRGLLVFAVIGAAVAAGVAVWKASRPTQDPWKVPAERAQDRPAQSSGPAHSAPAVVEAVKDAGAEIAGKAQHVAEEAKAAVENAAEKASASDVSERARTTARRAAEKIHEASQKTAEAGKAKAEEVKETLSDAKDKVEDAASEAKDAVDGK